MTPEEMRVLAEMAAVSDVLTESAREKIARALREAADYQDRLRQALEGEIVALENAGTNGVIGVTVLKSLLKRLALQGGPHS
jgi:hypothetical protein